MKIKITEKGRNLFNFRLPTALVLNSLVFKVCLKGFLKKSKGHERFAGSSQLAEKPFSEVGDYPVILRELKKARKHLGSFCLIEAKSSDGSGVEIWL